MEWFNDVHKVFEENNIEQRMFTTWMKVAIQLERLMQHVLLLTKSLALDIKHNRVIRNGFLWLNVFALMECRFHLLLFSEEKIYLQHGFLPIFTSPGDFRATQKDGLAIFIPWNGYVAVLSLQHETKQMDKNAFSFVMDMEVMLLLTLPTIVVRITLYCLFFQLTAPTLRSPSMLPCLVP